VSTLAGAPLAGWLSDKIIIRARKQRGGVWYPEDRLRATLPGALIFVPVSVLAFGLVVDNIKGKTGLVLSLICLYFNGFGVSLSCVRIDPMEHSLS
jgi:MFS family permease